jgi:short-chain Z-isoprenyl diphosphate synthase
VSVSTKAQSVPSARHVVGIWRSLTKPLYWLYERRLSAAIKHEGRLPRHIGIIMDGNRRFARTIGLDVKVGHDYGAGKAKEVLDWCLELGIHCVTLWGFSSENRGRAPDEVRHLHSLFAKQARELLNDERLHKNKVRVKVIGNIEDFPDDTKQALRTMETATADYQGMQLNIALGYGGREEIIDAIRRLLNDQARTTPELPQLIERITPDAIQSYLYTAGMPDPDFVIRTSGEVRLSGFLLWQTAYSEFYFCDAFWPSFRKVDFLRAIRSFQARERRFGK